MLRITEKAKERIVSLQVREKKEGQPLRVSVKGGGCSGLLYNLSFESSVGTKDKVFEDKGLRVVVDDKSLLYVIGTTLDFSGGLNGKGFQFINPNATRTCGCGESFSV